MREMPPRKYLLFSGIQVVLDISLLLAAFVAAYLLRFDFYIPEDEVRNFLIQLPLVVLLQFVALTMAGARGSIWRYTDLAHLKSFLLAAKEIEARGDLDLKIRGFVDDDRAKFGRSVVQSHKVLGDTQDLPQLVRSLGIDHVVITIAHASRHQIHRIVRICEEIPVKVRIIPELYEII